MAFKMTGRAAMGESRPLPGISHGGEINKKLKFKSQGPSNAYTNISSGDGKSAESFSADRNAFAERDPLPGVTHGANTHKLKVEHKDLKAGITAEAISANKIVIDKDVPKDSKLYQQALVHEAVHAKEIAEGRIAYGDDWVRSDGKTYPRKDGKIKYNGTWHEEGSDAFPWEQRAMKAEKNV